MPWLLGKGRGNQGVAMVSFDLGKAKENHQARNQHQRSPDQRPSLENPDASRLTHTGSFHAAPKKRMGIIYTGVSVLGGNDLLAGFKTKRKSPFKHRHTHTHTCRYMSTNRIESKSLPHSLPAAKHEHIKHGQGSLAAGEEVLSQLQGGGSPKNRQTL